MAEFEKLSADEAITLDIRYSTKRNPETKEVRARLTACDVDVTITSVPENGGGWQKSHRHEKVVEITNIIFGEIIVAERKPLGAIFFKHYGEDSSFKTTPNVAHNVFVLGGTVMSTIKLHDKPDTRDWVAVQELDDEILHLSYDEARERCV